MKKILLLLLVSFRLQSQTYQSIPIYVDTVIGSVSPYSVRVHSLGTIPGLSEANGIRTRDSLYVFRASNGKLNISEITNVSVVSTTVADLTVSASFTPPMKEYGAVVSPGSSYTRPYNQAVDADIALDSYFNLLNRKRDSLQNLAGTIGTSQIAASAVTAAKITAPGVIRSIPFAVSAGALTGSYRLTYDSTNVRLGVGVFAPSYTFDAKGGQFRFTKSGTVQTPNAASFGVFGTNDAFGYLQMKYSSGTKTSWVGSDGSTAYYSFDGGGGHVFYTSPNSSNYYSRFGILDTGVPSQQYLGGSTASAGTATNVESTIFTTTTSAAVSNTTTETTILGTAAGTKTLPANLFQTAGRTIRVTVRGTIANTGTPTLDVKLKLGSTTIASLGATTLSAITGTTNFVATVDVTCRATGASGTVQANGIFTYFTAAGTPASIQFADTNTTINTTVTQTLDVTATWGTASASNTITGTISAAQIVY